MDGRFWYLSMLFAWICCWTINRVPGDLRNNEAHMMSLWCVVFWGECLNWMYMVCAVMSGAEFFTLQWCDSVSNHQPHNCYLSRLFRRSSKKISKLRVTSLCEFPATVASNAENVSIWWRHHEMWSSKSGSHAFLTRLIIRKYCDICFWHIEYQLI